MGRDFVDVADELTDGIAIRLGGFYLS